VRRSSTCGRCAACSTQPAHAPLLAGRRHTC